MASVVAFSFASRLLSCLLLAMTSPVLAILSWRLLMVMAFFFWSASNSQSLVCASRSSSRMDLPTPSPLPSCWADTPATAACMFHCAFSISLRTVSSAVAKASHSCCSFLATFSLASTCFCKSDIMFLPFFWDSRSAFRSASLLLSFDSVWATSLDSFECSSSSFFNSFPDCESRADARSLISFAICLSRTSNVFKSTTNCLTALSRSSSCWFLFSSLCRTWVYSKATQKRLRRSISLLLETQSM
mmetsp:Transcript_70995/g.148515  ORF Transcript_70995/g.148515 Transcript_70995/m.148515 type:complete len:245 (+) Transcript_70995:2832-3566(+)